MWTEKKQRAYHRHKAIEKLDGPTDFAWVQDHPDYVPDKPKLMRQTTFRRLRKRLVTRDDAPSWRPEDSAPRSR
jgi:hypothetical protein